MRPCTPCTRASKPATLSARDERCGTREAIELLTALEFVLKPYYRVEAGRTLCAEAAVPCGMCVCVCVCVCACVCARACMHKNAILASVSVRKSKMVRACLPARRARERRICLRGAGVGADAADAEDAAAVGDELPVDYPSPGVEHHLYIHTYYIYIYIYIYIYCARTASGSKRPLICNNGNCNGNGNGNDKTHTHTHTTKQRCARTASGRAAALSRPLICHTHQNTHTQ